VPLVLSQRGSTGFILKLLHLPETEARTAAWQALVHGIKNPKDDLTIHVVGKYTGYEDSYKSLNEAVFHGGFANHLKARLNWVEAEALEKEGGARLLDDAHGILGRRIRIAGTRGMMKAAEYARERGFLLRDLLRLPVGDRGVRAPRVRSRRRRFDRGRRNAPHKVIYKLRDLLASTSLAGRCGLDGMPASWCQDRWPGASTARI